MNIIHLQKIVLLSLVAVVSTSCATIVCGTNQRIPIESMPSKAEVQIKDNRTSKIHFQGKTPAQVTLHKRAGFFRGKSYAVIFEKEGYFRKCVRIKGKASWWYLLGNLFWGLYGYLVDAATDAMWTLTPKSIIVVLEDISESPTGEMAPRKRYEKIPKT